MKLLNQGKARESVWEFQGNLGLNFDLCRESMALESGNTVDYASRIIGCHFGLKKNNR